MSDVKSVSDWLMLYTVHQEFPPERLKHMSTAELAVELDKWMKKSV